MSKSTRKGIDSVCGSDGEGVGQIAEAFRKADCTRAFCDRGIVDCCTSRVGGDWDKGLAADELALFMFDLI